MKNHRDRSKLSRRDFLATTAASLGAAGLMGAGCMDNMMSTLGMKKDIPVGVQLYSVRAECAKDLPGTVAKVAQMG